MSNKNISVELNDEYIRNVTILKLKRNYGFVEREEFKRELTKLGAEGEISDYEEMLTFLSFKVILERIEEIQSDNNVKILFNEIVEVPHKDDYIPKTCDVILIGKDAMEVIKIVSNKNNVIDLHDNNEIKLLGIGAIDKYLSRMDCKILRLITIQPNLEICSIYETTIDKMLHEYDFSLSWD